MGDLIGGGACALLGAFGLYAWAIGAMREKRARS